MSLADSYNFKTINEQHSSSGVVGKERLLALREEGVEHVINLLPDDSEYAVPGEHELITSQGINYHYIPVDFAAPSKANVADFYTVMEGLGASRTHIHCAANYRASAFYSCFAVKNQYWATSEAKDFIASIWNPKEYPVWAALLADYGVEF